MPLIEYKQFIKAPIEVCFDLARDLTALRAKGKAVGGVTKGFLEEGDSVTWEFLHFGLKQRVTSRIIFMEKPYSFIEKTVKGPFRSFIYIHQFIEEEEGTTMIDHFQYKLRFGPIGGLMDKLLLAKRMENFIFSRATELKKMAEIKTNQTFD